MKRLILAVFAISLWGQFPEPGQGNGGGSGGGGGAAVTSLRELTDCKITRTSSTVLTIAACPMGIGENVTDLPAATVTLSTPSASSTLDIRVDSTGALIAVNPGATLATCNASCTVSAVTPPNSIRIGTATYSAGLWDVSGITPQTTMVRRDLFKAGALISLIPDAAGVIEIASTNVGGSKSLTIFDPVTGDSGRVQIIFPTAVTLTRISCSVKAATSATINAEERAAATPDTAGTAVLTSNLACDTDGASSTTFSNATIAAEVPLALTITAVSGTPDTLRVFIEYTVD